MRSLQIVDTVCRATLAQPSGVQHISVDYDTGNVFAANATAVVGFDPKTGEAVHAVSLAEQGYVPQDGSVGVVGLQHLPDQMSACIATASGDVILWSLGTNELECVGTVDSGLTAMSWSPDQELAIFATGENTLIMMTREFDPIAECPIHTDEFGEAKFVTVGWGKKETQFHGSEGKEAAKRKVEGVKPAHAWDDRKVRLSWRGDGQFVVVSAINPLSGARGLKVFTRDMVLHSSSEKVDGLEQCLGWKPTGSLIASSQRKPNKHDVVFFEKNGLTHGGFTLPFGANEVKVREVLWNNDSSVLAVWCEEMSTEDKEEFHPKSYVQLWTVNNYHWYLKQSFEFKGTARNQVSAVSWDPEHAYRIHIMCVNCKYLQYTLAWATFHSIGRSSEDLANVAVIDGDKLLMTPLRSVVVPPPMSAYHLHLPAPASAVTYDPTPGSNDLAVLLNNGSVVVFTFDQTENQTRDETVKMGAAGGGNFNTTCKTPRVSGVYRLGDRVPDTPLSMHHLTWVTKTKFIFCYYDKHSQNTNISTVEITGNEFKYIDFKEVTGSVVAIAVSPETGTVVVQLGDRTLLTYDVEGETYVPFCDVSGEEITLPLSCTQMDLCRLGDQEVVLGLTDRFRFYVNDIEVANNCTSFGVHNEFLLLTTHSHTCRCINRNTQLKALPTLSDGKAHPFDETVRRVERGSRMVHVVPEATTLILQMPRGNLETIHPRALVLSAVRKCLDGLQFGEAFNLMRKHRINMNLIHDHSPTVFTENVDKFIRQVANVNHINLFLSDLQEEDVTVTMYTAAYTREDPPPAVGTGLSGRGARGKVDRVCEAVRRALQHVDPNKYLLSVLTTYVKMTSPQLDVALSTVKELKETNEQRARVEEAMKYLLLLVDVNELYDHALGTYDFDLVLMVAERSQKDPKEYLPFLNTLRKMEESYQRFSIDTHLKRYRSALKHIVNHMATHKDEDHFSECLALARDHHLYADALRLLPADSQHYKDMSMAYGSYLSSKGQPAEAGLVFARAALYDEALAPLSESGCWRQAIVMAARAGLPTSAVSEMAARMARSMATEKPVEAACLLEQYCQDIEEAITTCIRGAAWDEALRLMYKHGRTDFIESDFEPALDETHTAHMEGIDQMRNNFERHTNRLVAVRQEKERVRLELLEGGGDYNQADADLFSDTSSATGQSDVSSQYSSLSKRSSRSSSSRRSGKSRRKAERKIWSLKEGSRYEDIALVEALSQLCKQAEELKDDVNSLLQTLVLHRREEKAVSLQTRLDAYLQLIHRSIPLIWETGSQPTSAPTLGPEATTNSIVAAIQQGQGLQFQDADVNIDPSLRIPPHMIKKWKLHLLGLGDTKL